MLVLGVTVTTEGAEPDVAVKPNQLEVTVDDQPSVPVPRLETWKVCDVGFRLEAPKKLNVEGVTERTAVFTANVTGMEMGEFAAPGAERVIVAV